MQHTYDKGDRVAIVNRTMSGKFIVEGYASVTSRADATEHYKVRFTGDRASYLRFVNLEAQEDPYKYVAELNKTNAEASAA